MSEESLFPPPAPGPMFPDSMAQPLPASPPSPPVGGYVLAGWWRRAGSMIIDGFILLGITLVVVFVVAGAVLGIDPSSDDTTGIVGTVLLIAFFTLALVIAYLVYAPVMMARTNGQTVGRMATGIRVIRVDGQRMDFAWAALREVVVKGLLFGTVGSFFLNIPTLLDYLWPLWDEENRALHDMVVGTRVVRA